MRTLGHSSGSTQLLAGFAKPVSFGQFLVEPVRHGTRTGRVPTPKLCLNFVSLNKTADLTGLPADFF
jgi:hypothetical protein